MMKLIIVFSILLFLMKIHNIICISTIGIDLGCEIIKIGIAKPSLKISLASDEFGNKLISSAIFIKGDQTLFGSSAFEMITDDPNDVYLQLPCLIGKGLDDEEIRIYQKQFPYYIIKEDKISKSIYFTNQRNETFFVDELLALILDNAMKIANERIKSMYPNKFTMSIDYDPRSAVIAVPINFQQRERKSLLSICRIANISVLQLFDSNTAAFLTMISTHLKRTSKYGIYGILDIGAEHIQMSIADIQRGKSSFRSHSFETSKFTIISSSFETNAGVQNVIRKMQEYFITNFKRNTLIERILNLESANFISKLYMSCRELLRILRYSDQAHVNVKRLFSSKDFKISMNKTVLIELASETLESISKVIKGTLQNVPGFWLIPKGVTVIGGGRFLPQVDVIMKQSLKRVPYLKIMDPFLDVAWGSVKRATNMAPGLFHFPIEVNETFYKSVKIRTMENERFEVTNIYFTQQQNVLISTTLFRSIRNNFNFSLYYIPISISRSVCSKSKIFDHITVHDVLVDNVTETITNMIQLNVANNTPIYIYKGVQILYSIDKNSIIKLESVDAVFVKKTILNITNITDPEELMNTSQRFVVNETKFEFNYIKLKYSTIQPYQVLSKKQLFERILKTNNTKWKTGEYFQKEAVRNELEYFITEMKRKFNEKDYIICTSDIERRIIWSFLDDTTRWMKNIETKDTTKKEYFDKFDRLINLTDKVDIRVHEIRNRPILVKKLLTLLESTQQFIMNMFVTSGAGVLSRGIFTKNETNKLRQLNKETRIWFSNFTEMFQDIKPYDDPPILCDEIIDKIIVLETHNNNLLLLMDKRMDPNEKQNNDRDNLIENKNEQSVEKETTGKVRENVTNNNDTETTLTNVTKSDVQPSDLPEGQCTAAGTDNQICPGPH